MTQLSSASISPARRIAFEVLRLVAEGQYASDALRSRSRQLAGRDAGLAAQIVFGSLRFQAQLDYLIYFYSRRRIEMLDAEVTIALRMALFQLRYLERIPAHAAVHETVELIKTVKRPAAGLANAVLRKVRRDPVAWLDLATELSCPEWLLDRWAAHFGKAQALEIAQAALLEPVPYIRIPSGALPPPGLELESTNVPGCFRVLSSAVVEGEQEQFRLHDIGSQAVLSRLDLRPGHSYLDICAAPGNKTRQALETPLSLAIACDSSFSRLETFPPLCHRVVLDGTRSLPFRRTFDRIFIDAPCSGTGTCGRNPEIKWRVQEPDFKKFGERQVQLIASALPHLAPGGKLLYATCSLEREENEDVVQRILDRTSRRLYRGEGSENIEIALESEGWRLPGPGSGDGFYGALFTRR